MPRENVVCTEIIIKLKGKTRIKCVKLDSSNYVRMLQWCATIIQPLRRPDFIYIDIC